ncbi:hypothetical protein Tcan_18859 [Toxocara canis]|uniref:Uncharacterized protein n=1 Tax=Toxocara canis TaxID=6265 RepID=A0A0B2W148_TOXCA|nr:hypothetical protein Tcan_18859 [Toxocara canis]
MTAETNKLREEADRLRRRCETLETKISELKAEGRRRVRSPASLGMNRSFASSRSSDRNSRSSLEFSFIVPGTCRSDHQNVRPGSRGHNALLEHLPETMLNESTEPSSIVADSLVTTPAILGIGKSERSKRAALDRRNLSYVDGGSLWNRKAVRCILD